MSLAVSDLAVRVGTRPLVGPVSFEVSPGEPLTILGETGAGKSLLAHAIMGSLASELTVGGAVHLDGRRLDTLPRRDRQALWGRSIALLPQEPWRALDPLMRSGAQVAETHVFVTGRSWQSARSRASVDLTRLGLDPGAHDRLPATLSGGMAQRVAFAAATASSPLVLMADEPTKGLDDTRREDVISLLQGFVAASGILITITHDVVVARALGGKAMILRSGAVVEEGPAERVLAAPASAYGRELVAADPANWQREPRPIVATTVVLRAEQLAVARGGRTLVSDLDFALHAGSRFAVTGPSGIGKTSLLDTLAGLIPPSAGRMERRGAALEPHAVQKLYQDPPAAFAAKVSIKESFRDLERRHKLAPNVLNDLTARLGLAPELLSRRPIAVSGGELQRLALARVLALRPAIILADEPTSRLDPVTQKHVMHILSELAREAQTAVVLVTHSTAMAERWADATLRLDGC